MMKSMLKLKFLLMISLSLLQQNISAEVNLLPKPLTCLDRGQLEKAVSCCEKNEACHQALEKSAQPPSPGWELLALAIAGGVIGGMVLDNQIHH